MKKHISILFFLLAFNAYSQSLEKLKATTKKLYEANYLMDFEAIANMSYSKSTEIKEKELLLENIEKHYENETYRLRLQLEKVPFQYGTLKEWEGKTFCFITFRNPIRYTFETKLTDAMIAEKKAFLEKTNDTQEVTFEPARNSFNVRKKTTYVAVIDENTDGEWKFFNLDIDTQNHLFEEVFKGIGKGL